MRSEPAPILRIGCPSPLASGDAPAIASEGAVYAQYASASMCRLFKTRAVARYGGEISGKKPDLRHGCRPRLSQKFFERIAHCAIEWQFSLGGKRRRTADASSLASAANHSRLRGAESAAELVTQRAPHRGRPGAQGPYRPAVLPGTLESRSSTAPRHSGANGLQMA